MILYIATGFDGLPLKTLNEMRTHFPRLLFSTFLMSLQPDTITSTTRTRDGRTRDGEHDGYCCMLFTREFYYFCCASPPTACNSVARQPNPIQ